MAPNPYTKPYFTPDQRVAHLRARGLLVARPSIAARRIDQVGYERLRIYFISRRQLAQAGKPFEPGTRYTDVLRLYECDGKLRDICFAAVGQFELLFRNALSEVLSRTYGAHPLQVPSVFRDASAERRAIQSMLRVVAKSRDQRITYYCARYSQPMLPPIWTLKEVLTFGSAAFLYKTLSGALRSAIAAEFGVGKEPVFQSWIECLVDLRNICAHHDRVFNRSFQKQPASLIAAGVPGALIPKKKLKALLQCLDHALDHRGTPMGVTAKIAHIISRYPEVRPAEVGY